MAHVFGAASATTNTTSTSTRAATAMPTTPNNWPATTPINVAWTNWATSSTNSNALIHRSGRSTRRINWRAPGRPSS